MCDEAQPLTNAERQAKHRRGLKLELREIKGTLEDLRGDLREVVKAALVCKSLAIEETRHSD